MPVISDEDGRLYEEYSYLNEAQFEADIVHHADSIFGPNSIYVDIKKKVKGGGIVSIPDGYVIDLTDPVSPDLYVVENEIASHDVVKHIGNQLLRFVTSFHESQTDIRRFLVEAIHSQPEKLSRLQNACDQSNVRNIDAYIDSAVQRKFRGLVIIDHAKPELHNLLQHLNANISVIEFNKFKSSDGKWIFSFDTLYDELEADEVNTTSQRANNRLDRKERRAKADTIIVPAQKDGFEKVFLGQNQWYAIRIGAAMKDKIKYIAAYQVRPVSAVTHIASVEDVIPYQDSGKYMVKFKEPAQELQSQLKLANPNNSPQGPIYARYEDLISAQNLEDALR